jgi:hypothetical protein
MNAVGSNDIELQRDIILDQIAELIKTNVGSVVDALIKSGVSVPDKYTKIDIINAVSKSIYSNAEFQKNIGFLIQKKTVNFSNGVGDAPAPAPTTGSKIGSALGSFFSTSLGSVFDVIGSAQDRKAAEANAKASLMGKIFGEDDKQKTNYIPIVIIGSVLLLGGIIAVVILKGK